MTEASESQKPPEIKINTAKEAHNGWVDTAKIAFWGGIGTAQAGIGSVQLLLAERTSNTVPATIAKVF